MIGNMYAYVLPVPVGPINNLNLLSQLNNMSYTGVAVWIPFLSKMSNI